MTQTKRQRAIIIDIKNRIESGKRSKQRLLNPTNDFEKRMQTNNLVRNQKRREFLNKKLQEAQSGKPIFKKNLTTDAQFHDEAMRGI